MFRFNDSTPMPLRMTRLSAPRHIALPFLVRALPGHAIAHDSRVIRIRSAFRAGGVRVEMLTLFHTSDLPLTPLTPWVAVVKAAILEDRILYVNRRTFNT